MPVIMEILPTVDFVTWIDQQDLKVTVRERTGGALAATGMPYYASINAEVMREGCLTSRAGNGASPDEALQNLMRWLDGQRLAIGAYTDFRHEVDCPHFTYRGITDG